MPDVYGIQFRVVEADVRSYATDVLVLKYAQASYGADSQVANAVGVDPWALPPPANHLIISAPERVAAKNLVFLGVQELDRFNYKEIRDFGRRALITIADLQDIREVTLTLHGAGYGLDEHEAFDSEGAGVIDALLRGHRDRRHLRCR